VNFIILQLLKERDEHIVYVKWIIHNFIKKPLLKNLY